MTINFQSISNIAQNSSQVMLYGWDTCKSTAKVILSDQNSPIKKILDWSIGRILDYKDKQRCLDNREIEQISLEDSIEWKKKMANYCKAGITNLILENYKRKKEGLPIIPLFFCLHMEIDHISRLPPVIGMTSRKEEENHRYTHKELRRCYKLYSEFKSSDEPVLKELAAVATETFKFINIKNRGKEISFEKIDAPWESTGWDKAWQERMSSKKTKKSEKQFPWRDQLKERIRDYFLRVKLEENIENFSSK